MDLQALTEQDRQRGRAKRAIEALWSGHDRDRLVGTRLHPNRMAIVFQLLVCSLAIGQQIAAAGARPAVIRESFAFPTTHIDTRGIFTADGQTIHLQLPQRTATGPYYLPWTHRVVRCAA